MMLREPSFGMIRIRIGDPRSLGSLCIQGIGKYLPRVDSLVPSTNSDPNDLGSLILIPKEPLGGDYMGNFNPG